MSATATMRLLSATKKRPGQLSNHATATAAAVSTLLLAAEKLVHREASQSSSAVASRPIHTPCSIADIWALRSIRRLVVWIRVLRRCAVVRASAHGGLASGQFPLRHAGADLNIVVLSR